MGFQKGQVANPKGRGKSLNKTTLLAREFASSIVDRPDVVKKTLDMWLAGELPPATMNLLLMYRYGRPKHVVEVQQPQSASRKDLLKALTSQERRELNRINMAMLRRSAEVVDVTPVATGGALVARRAIEGKLGEAPA